MNEKCIDINICDKDNTGIVDKIKEVYNAGRLACVYLESDNAVADNVIRQLEKAGYRVERVVYPIGATHSVEALGDILALGEEVRFLIGVGGRCVSELLKLSYRAYAMVLTRLDTSTYLTSSATLSGELSLEKGKAPSVVFIDKKALLSCSSREMSIAYGEILSYYTLALDLRFKQGFARVDMANVDKLESILDKYLSRKIIRNSVDTLDRLIEVNINISRLIASLPPQILSLERMSNLALSDITSDVEQGELSAMWTLYIFEYARLVLGEYRSNLLYPSELSGIIMTLSERTNIPMDTLVKSLPNVDSLAIKARDYTLREYREELLAWINSKADILDNAIVNMRRLTDDAGLTLAKSLPTSRLVSALKATSLFASEYTLFKHLILLGVA